MDFVGLERFITDFQHIQRLFESDFQEILQGFFNLLMDPARLLTIASVSLDLHNNC